MKNIMREQIRNLFTDPKGTLVNGLWFSGYKLDGEYKRWWIDGGLRNYFLYKNKKLIKNYLRGK